MAWERLRQLADGRGAGCRRGRGRAVRDSAGRRARVLGSQPPAKPSRPCCCSALALGRAHAASAQAAQWQRPRRVPPLNAQKPGHSWLFQPRGGEIPCLRLELECASPQDSQDKCCLGWKLISWPFLRNAFDLDEEGLTGKLYSDHIFGKHFLEV